MATTMKNSMLLRKPLLEIVKGLMAALYNGPQFLRRAMYDSEAHPHIIADKKELYIVATKDKVIGREIFLTGEYDFNKLRTALTILSKEGIPTPHHLIDVGANLGSICIPAVTRGLFTTATAVEAHPDNCRLLRANVALNNAQNLINVIEGAATNRQTSSLCLKESTFNGGNHMIGTSGIPVLSICIDDLVPPNTQALLWMDIEGHEGFAIDGAKDLISKGAPIVCEFNPKMLRDAGGLELLSEALQRRRIFDLNSNGIEYDYHDLLTMLASSGNYTDILSISTNNLTNTIR